VGGGGVIYALREHVEGAFERLRARLDELLDDPAVPPRIRDQALSEIKAVAAQMPWESEAEIANDYLDFIND
jgi:hypothetical protein